MKDIKAWAIVGLLLIVMLEALQIKILDEKVEMESVRVTRAQERTQIAIESWSAMLKECEKKAQACEAGVVACEAYTKKTLSVIDLLPQHDRVLVIKAVEADGYKKLLNECLKLLDTTLDKAAEHNRKVKKILED